MSKPKVHIVHSSYQYVSMFESEGWEVVPTLAEADFVQFTGGADVSPHLYNHPKLAVTHNDVKRDVREQVIYEEAKKLGKPCLGICRGAQFLNVMNGGEMWQDVDNHAVRAGHSLIDLQWNQWVNVTSTHHQMMKPSANGLVRATARESNYRLLGTGEVDKQGDFKDVEVVWYGESQDLCFQPHPEFIGAEECKAYYFNLIEDLYHGV